MPADGQGPRRTASLEEVVISTSPAQYDGNLEQSRRQTQFSAEPLLRDLPQQQPPQQPQQQGHWFRHRARASRTGSEYDPDDTGDASQQPAGMQLKPLCKAPAQAIEQQATDSHIAGTEDEGLSPGAIEKLTKLKVFQHLRERHKLPQQVSLLVFSGSASCCMRLCTKPAGPLVELCSLAHESIACRPLEMLGVLQGKVLGPHCGAPLIYTLPQTHWLVIYIPQSKPSGMQRRYGSLSHSTQHSTYSASLLPACHAGEHTRRHHTNGVKLEESLSQHCLCLLLRPDHWSKAVNVLCSIICLKASEGGRGKAAMVASLRRAVRRA